MDDARGLRVIGLACLALIGALMAFGLQAGSGPLYAVFSTPALAAAALALAKRPWARWAAAPIFVTWLLVVGWLFLSSLGPSRLNVTAPMLAAVAVVVAACVFGLVRIARRPGGASRPVAVAVFVLFGLAQIAALAIGYQGGRI